MKAQKTCPKCNQTCHARVSTCKTEGCGHVFYAKKGEAGYSVAEKPATTRPNPAKPEVKVTGSNLTGELRKVLAPAGHPPVKLEVFTTEGLREWAEKTQAEMNKTGFYLSNEALRYWARKFYPFFKDEEKEKLVKETFPVDIEGI